MNRRRGFTLIEMVAVVGISSMLAGIAVFMLISLLKSHGAGREHLAYCRTLNRLGEQFRGDVHARQKTSLEDNGAAFELPPNSADDTTVRYQCLADRIDRTELQGEKVVRLESYMLPPDVEASIKTRSDEGAEIVCVVISPKSETPKLYYTAPIRIEAVLDRDSRLSKVQTQKKKEETEKAATEQPPAEQPATEKASAAQPSAEDKPSSTEDKP